VHAALHSRRFRPVIRFLMSVLYQARRIEHVAMAHHVVTP
jgi:hypothetical protein